MATVNEKMTALADEIRELSGTTTSKSIDAMRSDVDAANAEIADQAELLEQIATALEGKTGGIE
jgi:outer membrane murein-binding lipoprotein Lpp